MSDRKRIEERVRRIDKGKPFLSTQLGDAGPRKTINRTLSSMVKEGALVRLARGVYARPKVVKFVGAVTGSPTEVMHLITSAKGEIIQIHGAEAVRRFHLSTQMPIRPTYYTSGRTRTLVIGKAKIQLIHAPRPFLQFANTKLGTVISALFYLAKEPLCTAELEKVLETLSASEMLELAKAELPGTHSEKIRAFIKRAIDQQPNTESLAKRKGCS